MGVEDQRPAFIKNNEVAKGQIVVKGVAYPYTVLSRAVQPRLPNFVGFPENKFLIVSEDVPTAYRPHVLGHEVREFTELQGKPGRCLISLKIELEKVPPELRQEYIVFRRKFFEDLVNFYHDSENKEFLGEITASRDYLNQL